MMSARFKNDQCIATVRISVAVDKARMKLGWQVHAADSSDLRFDPPDFNRLLSIARETA